MKPGVAIAGVVLIALGLFIGFGWLSADTGSAAARLHDPIDSVRIDNDSGNVNIRVGANPGVRETFHYRFSTPDPAYSVDDGELTLGDCGWWCSVDYDVVVPAGTTVSGGSGSGSVTVTGVASADLDTSSGTTEVRDVTGDVQVDGSSGDVNLHHIGGSVDVDASSGAVRGDGLSGPVTVNASSGDVELSLARPNDVQADASSGDVRLRLPDGAYEFDTSSGSGSHRVELPNTPGAPNTVEADASSGDVLITRA